MQVLNDRNRGIPILILQIVEMVPHTVFFIYVSFILKKKIFHSQMCEMYQLNCDLLIKQFIFLDFREIDYNS